MGLLEVKNLTFGYDNQIENVFDNERDYRS